MNDETIKLTKGVYRVGDNYILNAGSYCITYDSGFLPSVKWAIRDDTGENNNVHSFSLSKDNAQCHLDLECGDIVIISDSVLITKES